MPDEIPSPAAQRPAEPSRGGLAAPPWESALYDAVRALEARVAEAEAERDRLVMENHALRGRLRECRGRLDNWQLRQQAWRAERAELLERLR